MFRRIALITLAGAAAVALTSALAAPASNSANKLVGTTGPEWTITLKRSGRTVRTLKPGVYRLTVNDRSTSHNFRLRGPRTDRVITRLRYTGRRTVTVTLRKGLYTYLCDPHEYGGMQGQFRVK